MVLLDTDSILRVKPMYESVKWNVLNRKLDWCGEKKAIVSVRDDYDRNAC